MTTEQFERSEDVLERSAGLEDAVGDSLAQATRSDTAAGPDMSSPDAGAAANAESGLGASTTSSHAPDTAVGHERRSVLVSVTDNRSHDVSAATPSAEDIAEDKRTLGLFKTDLFQLLRSPPQNGNSTLLEHTGCCFEELVAKYAGLMNILEHPCNLRYSETACAGMLALRTQRLKLAENIYDDLIFATLPTAALTYVMRGAWRFLRYFIGIAIVILSIYIAPSISDVSTSIPILAVVRDSFHGEVGKVIVAAFFGCLGGVVSLLSRLAEFEAMRGRSRKFLTLTGVTLPVVGGVFAAVIGAIFAADIVNITANTEAGWNHWLFVVLGFLSGFSERFTRNILGAAEERLGGGVGSASRSENISWRVKESKAASTASQ
jgi:hypothetical protein